ncbi:cytochrome P450 1B1 [Tulasnella sp. UAMH 9824]|nr:cytochrome P450 1B1 [Tulasnella sp. UAMH 9824]
MPLTKAALTYGKWFDQYGPLTWAVASGKQYLIVHDYETMKELMERRGNIYIDRDSIVLLGEMIGQNRITPRTPYGPTWKQHRRFLNRALMAPIIKRDYAPPMIRKVLAFLTVLLDRPQDFLLESKRMTAELITEIAYGMMRDDENGGHDFVQMHIDTGKITVTTGEGYWVNHFPWMKHIPPWFPFAQWKRDAIKWRQQYNFAKDYMFGAVKKQWLNTRGEGMPTSFVRSLLQEVYSQQDPKSETELLNDEEVIKDTSFSLFRAGAATTESVIRTFLLAMTLHPKIQARVQWEIDAVIGSNRFPSIDDKGVERMPYLEATLLECMRWHTPVPALIPHLPIRDDVFGGYFIPKGTAVIGNAWQVSRDTRFYHEPAVFNPERFLQRNDKDGSFTWDASVLSPLEYVFGFGRRVCPGRDLAFQNAWITAVFVLWAFEIKSKDGVSVEDGYKAIPEEMFDFAFVSQTLPFDCEFVPRSEKALQMIRKAAI